MHTTDMNKCRQEKKESTKNEKKKKKKIVTNTYKVAREKDGREVKMNMIKKGGAVQSLIR